MGSTQATGTAPGAAPTQGAGPTSQGTGPNPSVGSTQGAGSTQPGPTAVPTQGGTAPPNPGGNPGGGGGSGGGGGGAGGRRSLSNRPTALFRPPTPTMGGLIQTGSEDYTPWVGGKPTATWSGLDVPDPMDIKPDQYRPVSAGSAQKSKHYRVEELKNKLHKGGKLQDFQKDLWKKMEDYGLDTITYLPDPSAQNITAATEMYSIVNHHSRFTEAKVKELAAAYQPLFDKYDVANNRDAIALLYDSIDEDIQSELDMVKEDKETFWEQWMEIISIIRTPTIDKFEALREEIRKLKVSSIKGHNIVKLTKAYQDKYKLLDDAGVYTHELTSVMLNEIMLADGENENFLFHLRPLKLELSDAILDIRYMDYDTAKKHMEKERLDVPSLLKKCRDAYNDLLDTNKWKTQANSSDSKAIPSSFGKVNKVEVKKPKAKVSTIEQLYALVQNLTQGKAAADGPKPCYNCGATDHFARECPKPKKQNGRTRHGTRNQARGKGGQQYKAPPSPPKEGESEIRTINGVKKYWCAKCNRWSPSHGTENHTAPPRDNNTKAAHAAINRVSFDRHPTCYSVMLNNTKNLPRLGTRLSSKRPTCGIHSMLVECAPFTHYVDNAWTTHRPLSIHHPLRPRHIRGNERIMRRCNVDSKRVLRRGVMVDKSGK